MSDRTKRVVDLVHELDGLEAERDRITAEIDVKISKAGAELAALVDGAPSPDKKNGSARRGRPGSGFGDKIVAMLQEHRGMEMGGLAKGVYGDDSPGNRHRIRAQLNMLKDRRRVKRFGPGKWEAIDTEAPAAGHLQVFGRLPAEVARTH